MVPGNPPKSKPRPIGAIQRKAFEMTTGNPVQTDDRFPIYAITHIHTEYSSGPASELDQTIRNYVHQTLGPDTLVEWGECFTTVARLQALLDSPRQNLPIGLIAITDHMNHRHHFLPNDIVRVAASEPRIAACAEVFCIDQDVDGIYRSAPEVLVYGDGNPVESKQGEYFGLSQATLNELFEVCRVKESDCLQTCRVLDYCAEKGIACCLAHPFDGHNLSFEATLDLISRARIVETTNGGFSATSARVTEDLIDFQNRVITGWNLSIEDALRYPLAQRLACRIKSEGRSMLLPWGGSDAHEHNFTRVAMKYLSNKPNPSAGDLFRALIETPIEKLLSDKTFTVVGEPGTAVSGIIDVIRILVKNMWRNRTSIFNTPLRTWKITALAIRVVREELRQRHQSNSMRLKQLELEFGLSQNPFSRSGSVKEPASAPISMFEALDVECAQSPYFSAIAELWRDDPQRDNSTRSV